MKININEKLKNSILNYIPKEYSNLEKAIFIYHQLCLKLNYSLEFFLDEEKFTQKYASLDYIEKVNGEDVNEVVCFSFNAIFVQLLIDAGICDNTAMYLNKIYSTLDNCLYPVHNSVILTIDNNKYVVDSTVGVLDKNDLTLSKYSTHKLTGWDIMHNVENIDEKKEILNNAIDKVQAEDKKLNNIQNKYITLKVENEIYNKISLEERIDMFKNCIYTAPDYSIVSFNYLTQMKKKLFSKLESGKVEYNKYNVELLFVKDKIENEYKAIFFCNKKGYTNEAGKENFNTLEINLISVKNRSIKQISKDEFYELLENGKIVTNKSERISIYDLHMVRDGYEK